MASRVHCSNCTHITKHLWSNYRPGLMLSLATIVAQRYSYYVNNFQFPSQRGQKGLIVTAIIKCCKKQKEINQPAAAANNCLFVFKSAKALDRGILSRCGQLRNEEMNKCVAIRLRNNSSIKIISSTLD